MSGFETIAFDNLIEGKCYFQNKLLDVLYDSGATHSFISHACIERLALGVSVLPFDVVVSTPTDKPITTSQICLKCPIEIEDKSFVVDLIFLPLSQLDVVLGMDWLSSNHVLLNCKDKTLTFGSLIPNEPSRLSATSVFNSEKMGNVQIYVVLFSSMAEKPSTISNLHVVGEFSEVFLEDISELPPEREMGLVST